jgi:formate dehydrogenase major subunit
MISYIIENKLFDEDYVVTHTNALFLGDEAFDFKDGLFSGYDEEHHKYDTKTWGYQLDAKRYPRVAKSLDDPHCVFTRLKTFVSRYTLEMGERITGVPADQIKQIAEMMAKNRPGSILYALGMTQHTTGVQGIRAFTILQLLLGNIGKPGGGVNALRGEPNVQGACDMAVLYNYYPGYLNSPTNAEPTIYHYVRKNGIADSKYLVNMLKAFFGEAATFENDYGYAWLPKRDASKDYGTLPMFEDALAKKLKFLWVVGQNPAVTLPNLTLMFDAMANLETLVVQEIWETETAAFWRRPGVDPKSINTEVILLPAAFFMEKNGTISNSGGMVQWRHAAVKPPGQALPDGEIVEPRVPQSARSGQGTRRSRETRSSATPRGPTPRPRTSLREINGYAVRDNPETGLKKGDLVRKVSDLKSDGSTSSGRLDLRGRLRQRREPLEAPRRDHRSGRPRPLSGLRVDLAQQHADPLQPGVVRSARQAVSGLETHRVVGRGGETVDRIRRAGRPRRDRRPRHAERSAGLPPECGGRRTPLRGGLLGPRPEVHRLLARLWPTCRKDGPLPEMYEPVESPVENVLHPAVKSNPTLKYPRVASHQPIGTVDKFPYVLMTSTVAEHWCAGSTTRNIPWLNELVPEPMLELPATLAKKLDIASGDWVKVSSARGELEVKALVTPRMKALKIGDQDVTVVWMPYNWGFQGLSKGPSVNHITIDATDPGAGTQETKACLVNVVKTGRSAARRTQAPRGRT